MALPVQQPQSSYYPSLFDMTSLTSQSDCSNLCVSVFEPVNLTKQIKDAQLSPSLEIDELGSFHSYSSSSESRSPSPTLIDTKSASLKSCKMKSFKIKARRNAAVQKAEAQALELKTFKCDFDHCGKIFKRSEHLKRHVRSIHTREKRKYSKFIFSMSLILISLFHFSF
jgi:hypothetical protein